MTSQQYAIGKSSITVVWDSIVHSKAEVIVSSDDCQLSMGGGVSRAIREAAGKDLAWDARKMVSGRRPPRPGDILVTSAGRLPAKYLLHAVTLAWAESDLPKEAIIRQATRKALDTMRALDCRSIAFPALGTGVAQIPPVVAASEMATVIASPFSTTNPISPLKSSSPCKRSATDSVTRRHTEAAPGTLCRTIIGTGEPSATSGGCRQKGENERGDPTRYQ